jgi:hypothetical protein
MCHVLLFEIQYPTSFWTGCTECIQRSVQQSEHLPLKSSVRYSLEASACEQSRVFALLNRPQLRVWWMLGRCLCIWFLLCVLDSFCTSKLTFTELCTFATDTLKMCVRHFGSAWAFFEKFTCTCSWTMLFFPSFEQTVPMLCNQLSLHIFDLLQRLYRNYGHIEDMHMTIY